MFSHPGLCSLLGSVTNRIIWGLSSQYSRKNIYCPILFIYLLINVFVFFNCWSFRVVTWGRRCWRKSSQQTAGVLLLAINKLLHKTFPCEQTEDIDGLKPQEELIFRFLYDTSQPISAKTVKLQEEVALGYRYINGQSDETTDKTEIHLLKKSITELRGGWPACTVKENNFIPFKIYLFIYLLTS